MDNINSFFKVTRNKIKLKNRSKTATGGWVLMH